jgi:opacity protein-like surface antigen
MIGGRYAAFNGDVSYNSGFGRRLGVRGRGPSRPHLFRFQRRRLSQRERPQPLVAYEPTSWLVAPLLQWGYTYAAGDVPAWESEGYSGDANEVKGEGDTFIIGGRVRVPLWRMKLRPYAGGGVAWTNYNRIVLADARVLSDNGSFGTGWAALGGLEFFPSPASGFSLALEYRYGVTKQEWRKPPTSGNKGPFELEFDLTEKLLTMGVKVYVL